MKIVQVNAVWGQGSTGRMTAEMADYINRQTDNTCYTAYACGSTDEKYTYAIGNKFERKIHAFFSRALGNQAYYSHKGTKNFLKWLDKIKPDVLCLGNLHGNYINLPMLFKYIKSRNLPTAFVLHDCWFFTGKCCHYTLQGCYKWKTGCGGCPVLRKYNNSWFLDRTAKMWKDKKEFFESFDRFGVIGVSGWIANEAASSMMSKAKIIKKIYNWIDLETFKPLSGASKSVFGQELEDKKVILGVAPMFDEDKGISRFIRLAGMLDENTRIVLVGNLAGGISLPDNIIHLGRTENVQKLVEMYSAADVFVTVSLEESFGKVSAEALSCGTPVVCFDSTANKELVGQNCGFAVQKEDYDGMKAAIDRVLSVGKDLYRENCRKYAEENFSMNTQIDKYIEAFRSLCEN